MAKAKDTAKEAPKARTSKAKEKAAERALLEGALTEAPAPLDAEARKTRLKNLIKLGKERGYLTYAEINDHLPDDVVDAEQIESIISTFNDMGIQVFDEAPAAEELLMSETAPAVADGVRTVFLRTGIVLSAGGPTFGIETEPGTWHSFAGLEPGSVLFELKPGPYDPAADKDFAAWAPPEGDPRCSLFEAWFRTGAMGSAPPTNQP